ncbi:CybS-domain-containing protein [Umbelopsis sp. PMI_123]|nr:CybS-domain-containing protein [Umbelopsis sp. PMI_123]
MSLLTGLRVSQHLRQKSAFAPVLIRSFRGSYNLFEEKTAKATDTAKEETSSDREKEKDDKEVSKFVMPNYVDGSFHWSYERATSAALIPLISTQFVYGPHLVLDGVLGLVLPLHLHIGFDALITDYVPARKYPRANKYLGWGLKATSAAVVWGCFEFNTNDVGITELIQRAWTA